jgi:hypothetical protein
LVNLETPSQAIDHRNQGGHIGRVARPQFTANCEPTADRSGFSDS